ncbi:M23 family metallopeptidase [Limnovirga soli]|uniref:Peptidoglycan DD-metalloendopeptidase family protein n=1 Tax=Limnovirga soli TaxID=2656915 RepID=A0A8J8FI50_9BACT|nr:hypothetical protein [Limnovirga soli]NNV58030.1 peptidoglycan DD-metalloendopeptidase family protein [Limnovirga soli]
MKRLTTCFLLFVFNACFTNSFGQPSTNDTFERAKGSLSIPLSSYKKIVSMDDRRHAHFFDRTDSSLTFITDSASEVKASFKGIIKGVFEINGNYTIMTKFGDYFLIYSGLSKPNRKVGETVLSGQILGKLRKEKDDLECALWFSVQKMDKCLDAYKWLKQQSSKQQLHF